MRSGIGGLLAQSGANIGSQIGGAYGQLGSDIQGMLSGIGAKRQQKKQTREVQELLAKYQNNPAQLNAVSAKYASEGNDALAKVFAQAAQRAKESNQQKVTRQEKRREVAGQRAEKAGARIDAASTELDTEIKKRRAVAIAKGRPQDADLVPLLEQDILSAEDYGKGITGKKGSQAKPTVVQETVMRDGRPLKVVQIYDSGGNLLKEHVVGEAPPEDNKGKRFIDTAEGSRRYKEATDGAREATNTVIKYDDLIKETERISEPGALNSLPIVGGIIGDVRDFAISDVAGLGDAITVHRARLNEVQMQNAIALLPRGPASDRDVKLALNASVDPKDLSPEDRVSYLRGMKKIAQAEQEYLQGKVRYIEETGDPNALGYERYAAVKGLEKKEEAIRTDFPSEVGVVDSYLAAAVKLAQSGKTEEARQLVNQLKAVAMQERNPEKPDEPSPAELYISTMEQKQLESDRWETFKEKNQIIFM
jgi:hypothetical protein